MNKPLAAEYLAGLFDGEGCVRLKGIPNRRARHNRLYTSMSCIFTNTDKAIMLQLQKQLGGNLRKVKRTNLKHKVAWQLWLDGQVASAFLSKVTPFLRIKHRQAKLALQYAALSKKYILTRNGLPLTTGDYNQRVKLINACQLLNRRGVWPSG